MKHIIALVCLLLSLSMSGQTVKKEEIIGKCKTLSLEAIGKIDPTELKELKKMFLNAVFTFDANGSAVVSLPNDEMGLSEMFKNAKWIFDINKSLIKIGTKADNYSVMGIKPVKEDNKIYFELLESGTRLLVTKQ